MKINKKNVTTIPIAKVHGSVLMLYKGLLVGVGEDYIETYSSRRPYSFIGRMMMGPAEYTFGVQFSIDEFTETERSVTLNEAQLLTVLRTITHISNVTSISIMDNPKKKKSFDSMMIVVEHV